MKKFISFILILSMLFAFAACSVTSKEEQPTATDNEASVAAGSESDGTQTEATESAFAEFGPYPTVYAEVSNENPAVGEEVIITVYLCNAPLFSSIDFKGTYNSDYFDIEQIGGGTIPSIVDSLKVDAGKLSYGGFVMRSANVENEKLFTLSVTPKSGAAGLQIITFDGINLLISLDEEGNQTVDKTNELQFKDILLTIQ